MDTTVDNWVNEIGKPSYDAIVGMVEATRVDYDRLDDLREDRDSLDENEREELTGLEEQAGDCENLENAEQRIQEDALSVEVRSGWVTPGSAMTAEEFCILLTTGGPAVRIRGELDEHQEPCRAWLEVQDWGKPWTRYFGADQETLLSYTCRFYFGG